jgi:hypothetical protein
MSFVTRAVISLLAGIGSGLLGFWAVWRCFQATVWNTVAVPGYDGWLIAGIFIPGVLVSLVVFRTIGQAASPRQA